MKTMKYITAIVFIAGLLFASCEVDYLSDPNEPEVAPTYGVLNRVQKEFMDNTRDEWYSGRQMLLWVQYWNQINYTEEDRFQYRETVNKGAWDDIYANAQDLIDIIEVNDVNSENYVSSMAGFGTHEAQIAVSRTMLVYIYLHAVEMWGDVPYWSYESTNESFQANKLKSDDIFTPGYATQSDIYADMLNVLEETQAVFNSPTLDYVMDGDNFFNGDPTQWGLFANSLRLRIANRIKGVYPAANAHITAAIAAGVMGSNADNAGVTYETNDLNASPMYRAFVVEARNDFAPSYSFVQLLKGNSTEFHAANQFSADPRLAAYVGANVDGNQFGVPLTDGNPTVTAFTWSSSPSAVILSPDYTEIYMEYSEVCFILSETNGWDQGYYEAGVTASMEKWGVAAADITAYIATLPAANEENVMMQKYIALYMQPMEAWSEYRRTGYPNNIVTANVDYDYNWQYIASDGVTVVDTTATFFFDPIGVTSVPTRNKYLNNEQNLNGTNYDAAVAKMGGDEQDTQLWWQ